MARPSRATSIAAVAVLTAVLTACGVDAGMTTEPPTPPSTVATSTSTTVPASTSTTVADAVAVPVYFIGNSLTWDTVGGNPNGSLSIDVMARQVDTKLAPSGFHINCGRSLERIRTHPQETCIEPTAAGAYPDAMGERWTAITIQPYPEAGSTLSTDEAFAREIARSLGDDGTLYVLTGWPPSADYAASWNAALPDLEDPPTRHSRAYFAALQDRLADAAVETIPIGEVLYRLDALYRSGSVPGLASVADLYRDDIHLAERGQWIAGVTALTWMLDVDPFDLGKPRPPWYGDGTGFTEEFMDSARRVIDDVREEGR